MSKPLSPDPITESDVKRYLNNYSDFSFELQVLKKFVDLGFKCSHSGTYEDPVTSKSRQYDIRALHQKKFIRVRIPVMSSTESGHAVQWRREATLVREL